MKEGRARLAQPVQLFGVWISYPIRALPGPKRRKLIAAMRERYGDRCCWCRCIMDFTRRQHRHEATPRDVSIEHVVPVADGGTDGEGNLLLACRGCNQKVNRPRMFIDQKQSKPIVKTAAGAKAPATAALHPQRGLEDECTSPRSCR